MKNKSSGETTGNGAISPPTGRLINLKINGADKQIEVAPWTTLLDLLRNNSI